MSEEQYIRYAAKGIFITAEGTRYKLTPEAKESLCGTYGPKFLTQIRNADEFKRLLTTLKKYDFLIKPRNDQFIISIRGTKRKNDVLNNPQSIDILADGDLNADAGELVEQAYHENIGEMATPKKPRKKTTRFDQNPILDLF